MEELAIKLNQVSDSYYAFVVAVLNYVNNNTTRNAVVCEFMKQNPDATSSDILEYISSQDDFWDDVPPKNSKAV